MSASVMKLPEIFSDGMVIAKNANIWGYASPNQKINANFLNKNYETVCDATGRFNFFVSSENFGGPHTLTIENFTIKNVFVGRVWLCGGQSNMETPLSRTRLLLGDFISDDARIKIFVAEKGLNFESPQKNVCGEWKTATGEFLNEMHAVPYFFARELLENYDDAPIGLVCVPAGGTTLESWLPEKIVREHPEIHEKLVSIKKIGFVDDVTARIEKNIQSWRAALEQNDAGLEKNFHAADFDDSDWDERALIDAKGSPQHGSMWLRSKFFLKKINGDEILNFGRAENSVKVFVNGTEILHVTYSYPPCVCKIPAGVLREGENTIALRIIGDSSRPLVVPGKKYEIKFSDERVDFTKNIWKWKIGAEMEKCPSGAFFFDRPCGAYNFMLAPLLGYSCDGMIWYQGESNTGQPHNYKNLFIEFVNHIREHFGENFPVIFTQLANYIDPHSYNTVGGFGAPGAYVAILREQQRQCLKIPHTAMAVTIDCGEHNDLHPVDKKTVAERLSLHARRLVYGEKIISDGPTVERIEYLNDVQKVIVHFKNAEGLWAKNGHPTLMILYKDGNVFSVFAAIKNERLEAPIGLLTPRAVRFGWADCPSVPIYNALGLPTSPFEEIIKDIPLKDIPYGGY